MPRMPRETSQERPQIASFNEAGAYMPRMPAETTPLTPSTSGTLQ